MMKINFKRWLMYGALYGFIVGLLVWVASMGGFDLQSTLGFPAYGLAGFAVVILWVILGAVKFLIGRFVSGYTKFFSKKGSLRLLQVAVFGYLVLALLLSGGAVLGNPAAFLTGIVVYAIIAFIAIYIAGYIAPYLKIQTPVE